MVLAAGHGERLAPLTWELPKPVLPVLGTPLIVHVLRDLARAWIGTCVLNLHHLPDALTSLLGDGGGDLPRLHYSHEPELLGTGGGVRKAAPLLRGSGTILVRNSDFLADIDLAAALDAHRRSGLPATLVLASAQTGYSAVEVNARGLVLSLAGRPDRDPGEVAGTYLFTGLQLIEEEVLDLLPEGRPSDLVRDAYRDLAAARRLGSWIHRGFWWEFGSGRSFLDGTEALLDLPTDVMNRIVGPVPVERFDRLALARANGVDAHAGVDLSGLIVLGSACTVAEGASLRDAIVLDEAAIGPGCRLERVVVGPRTTLPAGTELTGALVCASGRAPSPLPREIEKRRDGLFVRPFDRGPA